MRISIFFIYFTALGLSSCQPNLPLEVSEAMQALPKEVDYNLHVKPILSDKCFACHGPDMKKQKAGLRLDLAENAFSELPKSPGKVAIDPGNLKGSEVFKRITSTDPEVVMPTPASHLTLTPYEKAVIIKWIDEGATYKPHWAFVKPKMPEIPAVDNDDWVKNPIDNFILSKIEENKLSPAKQANKETLIRRVTFDLTGLPPTLPEIDAFVKDNDPKSYEKLVDRLLKSPHYGERMAVDWLDLARFADSHGYTVDRLRDMSPYRDWVIKAFNQNQPYNQFIHWQLAGDLMPNRTKEMIIATAFNRNHQQNLEGGIVEEEFQTEYVIDRTNTLGDAFLGLSVGCAKCHDHKYDPISQKNYYELYSFFNNVREAGQISWDDALPTPTLLLPTKEQEKVIDYIQNNLHQEEKKLTDIRKNGENEFNQWVKTGAYQSLMKEDIPKNGLIAKYSFDKKLIHNDLNPKDTAFVIREFGQKDTVVFTKGKFGRGLHLNGDAWFDLYKVGVFRKSDPFSIGIWVNIPNEMKEGVLFHKSLAERLYNFRGFHVYLRKNGLLEMTMAHTAPSNAITKVSKIKAPKNTWIHLTMTYDGSSKAEGLHLYLDGQPLDMETEIDQLTKDILLSKSAAKVQPGLQIGAWYRGLGFKNGLIDEITVYNRALTPFEAGILGAKNTWQTVASKIPNLLTPTAIKLLQAYYFSAEHQPSLAQLSKIKTIRTQLTDSTESIAEIMVMQEMSKPRQAYILERGNYNTFGAKVFPNTPERIFPFPKNLPKNRYGLAQWLTHPDHPMTARVIVNRLWQNIFGTGLVKSSEDFGNQGELPSHLELLDYLAITFLESDWDIKKLVKSMVMTATYQQDSRATKEKIEKDAENRLLARGPSNRLTAEMIRDNALAVSGLLNRKIGGKSVKPYQPAGLWEINNTSYKADSGEAVYRRSLYVIVKRSVPNPTLGTFDGTSRSYCVVRRQKTNTPLQALVTLNDPTFVEASKVLGEQMARHKNPKAAIFWAFRKLTGRKPEQKELDLLADLQWKEWVKFKKYPNKTNGWLAAGQYVVDTSLDAALVASHSVVANVMLNSDATLTKR